VITCIHALNGDQEGKLLFTILESGLEYLEENTMQPQDHLSYKMELLLQAKKGHFHKGNFGAPNKKRL